MIKLLIAICLISSSWAGDFSLSRGSFRAETIGHGLKVKAGTNGRIGSGTLVAGMLLILNNTVTANTRIFVQRTSPHASPLHVTKVPGLSFTVASPSGSDFGTFDYFLIESIP